jgi:hypothetical protein
LYEASILFKVKEKIKNFSPCFISSVVYCHCYYLFDMEPKVITTGTLNPEANIRGGGKPLMSSLKICPVRKPEPEFENLLRSPGIDSQPGGIDPWLQIQALLYKREGAGGVTPLPLTTTLFPS